MCVCVCVDVVGVVVAGGVVGDCVVVIGGGDVVPTQNHRYQC